MGSGFFKMPMLNHAADFALNTVGLGPGNRGAQIGTNVGPYTGVAPTLAGATAGYTAGGPGANPNPNAPVRSYTDAARAVAQPAPGASPYQG